MMAGSAERDSIPSGTRRISQFGEIQTPSPVTGRTGKCLFLRRHLMIKTHEAFGGRKLVSVIAPSHGFHAFDNSRINVTGLEKDAYLQRQKHAADRINRLQSFVIFHSLNLRSRQP